MNKLAILGGAAVVLVGAFVIGMNVYRGQQTEKVSQIAATDSEQVAVASAASLIAGASIAAPPIIASLVYQIAPSGGLAHSECFEIYGPEAC